MGAGCKKDMTRLVRSLEKQGWEVSCNGAGHWRLVPPDDGPILSVPSSPSSVRTLNNTKARLKRAGADV